MIQLNRAMMARYEIPDRRPTALRAALIGANQRMLGVAARLLDRANEGGANLGAICVTPAAEALRAQDCMFTLLIRGEAEDARPIREERVVQSILQAAAPEDAQALRAAAVAPKLDLIFLSADCSALEMAALARLLRLRWAAGMRAPALLLADGAPGAESAPAARDALRLLAREMEAGADFDAWLESMPAQALLCDALCGPLDERERARAEHDMNYRDAFIAWAEPQLRCVPELRAPEGLEAVLSAEDFAAACARKSQIFDALVFLCAAPGFLCGMDSFAQALADESLRAWIGRAFFDEILPLLPWPREEIAPEVISAFNRLENPMNRMPLLELGRGLMRGFSRTLLPAVRRWAEQNFEAPPRLSLALAAAVMLYAGARRSADGRYEVLRGDAAFPIWDAPEILDAFSQLAHDVPAETLAYAALADRDVWGADLREIDGLELRVSLSLSAIQRAGFREAMKLQAQD